VPVLALDVGGTKLAAALVGDDGTLLRTARRPTPAEPWPACVALLEEVRDGADGRRRGGRLRRADALAAGGGLAAEHALVARLPLREALSAQYRGVPVRVHNDAVCVALGEHWRGAGAGRPSLLGVVVSTGVGAGVVLAAGARRPDRRGGAPGARRRRAGRAGVRLRRTRVPGGGGARPRRRRVGA
jgi:glucokinase